ncbi:toll/interleukin-1 receptor domain-containing protein [Phytohabitans kaempferiae]|uniref:Toll/interleukin-1 receptor domain-containing protein n=1 Tax=Phytohabitans kaempferiae TaxID=1620943 RepID=A0ABV6LZL1_9ACTN
MAEFEFDVALSFAGEDRKYVERVAQALMCDGVRVFYDEFEQTRLWGEDLVGYLDDVYRNKSRYAVAFVSKHYAAKMWTSHERRSAQARALLERAAYLLPVRLDDAPMPGLPPTIGYLDGRTHDSARIAEFIKEKLGAYRTDAPEATMERALLGVPLTASDFQAVVNARPRGWEWLLLAGGVWQGVTRLEQKALDHELKFAALTGLHLEADQIAGFISMSRDRLQGLIAKLMQLVNAESLEWAIGPAGEPGNPTRISHLCARFASTYEELLDWAAGVRGTSRPSEFNRLFELMAKWADEPVSKVRAFADELVAEAGRIPAHFAEDTPDRPRLEIVVALNMGVDAELLKEFTAERNRLGL